MPFVDVTVPTRASVRTSGTAQPTSRPPYADPIRVQECLRGQAHLRHIVDVVCAAGPEDLAGGAVEVA